MPIHDWTRVDAGTFHDFHASWVPEIKRALNGGILPPDYYAMAEQMTRPWGPDVLTLETTDDTARDDGPAMPGGGGIAVTATPPKPRLKVRSEQEFYTHKRRTVVIRHRSGDRIVALIEIMSPGNKSSARAFKSFVDKAVGALEHGFHLLVIDLFPPTPRDPQGIHGAIWGEFGEPAFTLPPDEPLTLAAYTAGLVKDAYVEPTAVGRPLLDMPLFLDPERYVNVPLEETYQAAYRGTPRRWREVLE